MVPCQALESTRNTPGRADEQVIAVGAATGNGDVVEHGPAGADELAERLGGAPLPACGTPPGGGLDGGEEPLWDLLIPACAHRLDRITGQGRR
jgi:hypothetical protein